MPLIIDIHTHAFADALAPRAMAKLEELAGTRGYLDGTIGSLVASMDRAGISAAVVLSIATKPAQFDAILKWSSSIAGRRIVPFASVHPDDPSALENIRRIKAAGLRGLKMHPYYQNFVLDEDRLMPLYQEIAACGLALICHTGFDQAYPRDDRAAPWRIRRVVECHPQLKFVATHCGAWCDWEAVERELIGRPVWMDTAYALECMDAGTARRLLLQHPPEYLLFGTDSPWTDQAHALRLLRRLELGSAREDLLLGRNALRLLGLAAQDFL